MVGRDTGYLDIFVAHRQKLTDYANGIVKDAARAEDLVQEAFLRFNTAARERLVHDPVRFLYRVVRNLALDRRRRATLEESYAAEFPDGITSDLASNEATPEREAIARQELKRVEDALAALPERTRIAMEMHRLGGCTLQEIADHFGISVSRAHTLIIEGVRHCQRAL